MSLLFETIACVDGQLKNLKWHQKRLDKSYKALFNSISEINLEEIEVPKQARTGLWKCRVTYNQQDKLIAFNPYVRSKIQLLKIVESNLSYQLKFDDREEINRLFYKRGKADDILIVKDGFVTDSSKANALFFDGKKWVTPEVPLLPGTMRAQLLYSGKIKAKPISKTDLATYEKIMLVNAMNPFDDSKALKLPDAILN